MADITIDELEEAIQGVEVIILSKSAADKLVRLMYTPRGLYIETSQYKDGKRSCVTYPHNTDYVAALYQYNTLVHEFFDRDWY